jgi:hypothetical protein
MPFVGPDYLLAWPPDLLVSEIGVLLQRPVDDDWEESGRRLLGEAFEGSVPESQFQQAYGHGPNDQSERVSYLRQLLAVAETLPLAGSRKPLWKARIAQAKSDTPDIEQIQRRFAGLVAELDSLGYFQKLAGDRAQILTEYIGLPDLWPLSRSCPWDDVDFYSLIELLDDFVSRPRNREYHEFAGWMWSDLAAQPGQRLYRWRVNSLFDSSAIPLRLASSGENEGRLEVVSDDSREDLVARMVVNPDPSAGDRVRHAVALFRARDATVEEKRSAVIALAGVLEQRRALVKSELLRRDEGALFQIANNFSVRHQNADQRADYAEEYLDWLFWWYAATVELTESLIRRSGA